MQLRDGAVQHASARGVLQHDGSGSIHWEAATLWPHADADRVFPPIALRAPGIVPPEQVLKESKE